MTVGLFTPAALIGRSAELHQLSEILNRDEDCLVVGAPGTGRRTLIRAAAHLVGARLLEIDCLRVTSAAQFLRFLADALMAGFSSPTDRAWIQRWAIDQPLTLDETTARLVWQPVPSKEWALFETLLALPQQLADWLDCRVVVLFQNFPHIRSWDRQGKWEAHLRREIQQHSRVSYALVATVLEPWAVVSRLPVIHLGPLQNQELASWLASTLAAEGLKFEPEALELFLSYVQGHLEDAITLARRLWLDHHAFASESPLLEAHQVHRAMVSLAADISVTFEALILLLPPSQVRVLESLALDPTDSPQSRSYIKKHQLSRGGGLQGALNSLEQKGLIYGPQMGYRIALPFLEFWLRSRLSLETASS
jgi:hypothetical protein